MKRCSKCRQIDDGKRPVRVNEAIFTTQWGAEPITVSGPLCLPCYYDFIETAAPFFPESKIKRILNSIEEKKS